jgi:hypothetical protein
MKMTRKIKVLFWIVFFVIIVFTIGCLKVPRENPVCPPPTSEAGEIQDSWICSQSDKLGVEPEDVYDWTFTVTALATIPKLVERESICDFTLDVGDWYVENYPVSYTSIVNEIVRQTGLIDDVEELLLINSIINKHLRYYTNDSIISEYDNKMLRGAWSNFRQDMLCGN